MINAIIFSKDRACQLDLLLRSVALNSYKLFDSLTVIYTSSNEEYTHGYDILQKLNIIPINWRREYDLHDDVISSMRAYCKGTQSFLTFFTDDSVCYKNIHDQKFVIESCMYPGSQISCFSLRLGLNTKEQMHWTTGNKIDINYAKVGQLIKWQHIRYPDYHGYGYPMSVDGHIFRSDEITNLVSSLPNFNTVNGLEGQLAQYKYNVGPYMASFEQSALVIVPINRVQNVCENVAGMFYGISSKELNDRYLAGEVIDYNSIDFSNIQCTHQELKYGFKSIK